MVTAKPSGIGQQVAPAIGIETGRRAAGIDRGKCGGPIQRATPYFWVFPVFPVFLYVFQCFRRGGPVFQPVFRVFRKVFRAFGNTHWNTGNTGNRARCSAETRRKLRRNTRNT